MTDAATDGARGGDTATDGAAGNDAAESGSRSILRKSYGRTFRSSDSLVLRSYAVVSALAGIFLVLLVLLAMPLWIDQTEGQTPLNMVGRSLLPLVALGLLVPLVGPVYYAAKNHRREYGTRGADALLGVTGYLFVASIYLSLVISAPADARSDPPVVIAPVVEFLYSLPPLAALAPPVLGAVLVFLAQRFIYR